MPKNKRKLSRRNKLAYLDAALKYVKTFGTAIDAGAHVGHWTQRMATRFDHVYAYEPMDQNVQAWRKRMNEYPNAVLLNCALGDYVGTARMEGQGHSKHYAVPDDNGEYQVVTLDSINHPACDFLKIDCEGADLLVLRGAEELITKHSPVLIVEILREFEKRYGIEAGDLHSYLGSLGYKEVEVHWRDHIFVRS